MTPLSSIRLLIGVHLGEKGLPSSIITPVLNILKLADEEMRIVGYDFENPEIYAEVERLENAIAEMKGITKEYAGPWEFSQELLDDDKQHAIDAGVISPDPLSYLDSDDEPSQ